MLSEEQVCDFVEWKNKTNLPSKIQWLEDNQNVYAKFSPYWLELAKGYYKTENYSKCLDSISQYEATSTRIFRKDYNYAEVLPLAMVSAKETMDQSLYIETVEKYAEAVIENTDDDDWALRYFVAQIYLDLYNETQKKEYISKSYDIILNSVNVLVENQKKLNATYLADVQKASVPEGATKQQKKDIKKYNKLLKEKRKTELPPVNEALYLNCDLLFTLADQMSLSLKEREKIDLILHEGGEKLFLTKVLDDKFRFWGSDDKTSVNDINVTFDGRKLMIPTTLIADKSVISVKVNGDSGKETFNDWIVNKVKRPKNVKGSDFIVTFTSKSAKKYKYKAKDIITVQIQPVGDSTDDTIEINYTAVAAKKAFIINTIEFKRDVR